MKSQIIAILVFHLCLLQGSSHAYEAREVTGGGRLEGGISFTGKLPEPLRLPITKNTDICGSGVREVQEVMVDKTGSLRDAVVFFEKIEAGKKWEKENGALVQEKCRFVPWVQVMREKKMLRSTNSDPVLHNLHIYERIGEMKISMFNEALIGKGAVFEKKIKLRRSHTMKIECDAHPFMHAYVLVLKNPYFAVTDSGGSYSINGIPPGKYWVTVWHSFLGSVMKEVEIRPGKTTVLDYRFKSN